MNNKMKPICICFTEKDIADLKKAAHGELMSASAFLRKLLHEYLSKK